MSFGVQYYRPQCRLDTHPQHLLLLYSLVLHNETPLHVPPPPYHTSKVDLHRFLERGRA